MKAFFAARRPAPPFARLQTKGHRSRKLWCRTLAASQDRWLQGQLARRRGVGDTTPASRGGSELRSAEMSLVARDRSHDDDRTRSAIEGRRGHDRHDRSCRSGARHYTRAVRSLPGDDPSEEARRPKLLASRCYLQLARVLREWPAGRRKRGCRSTRRTLVQRTDRRPDHQAQARETPDVWSRETRSSPRQTDRCRMTSRMTCTEIESEPNSDPL